jgi:hypothetical protein
MAFYDNDAVRFGVGVSGVTQTQGVNDPELGQRANVAGNEYVFVYNAGAGVTQNQIVVLQSGSSGYSVTGSSVVGADPVMGVAANTALAAGDYGWVLTRGFADVEPASATVSGMMLIAGTDGQASDPIAGASTGTTGFVFARAQEQTAACGAAKCYVNCF